MSRSLLACALCMTTGCSLVFVGWPPAKPPPPPQVVNCTTSSDAPLADRNLAIVTFLAGTALAVHSGYRSQFDRETGAVWLGLAVLPALVFGLSSRTGYKRMEACERYHEKFSD